MRGRRWLTSDEEKEQFLKELGVDIKWNPREDQVPATLLTAIVTELGVVRLADQNDAKATLESWKKKADEALTLQEPSLRHG